MMDYVEPYMTSIVQALVGLVAVLLLALFASAREKVKKYIESHTNAKQREMLYGLAQEGAALAEATILSGGAAKLQTALIYVSDRAGKIGANITPEDIRATVEKAVMEFNKHKPRAPITAEAPIVQEAPAAEELPIASAPVDDEAAIHAKLDAIMAALVKGGGPA